MGPGQHCQALGDLRRHRALRCGVRVDLHLYKQALCLRYSCSHCETLHTHICLGAFHWQHKERNSKLWHSLLFLGSCDCGRGNHFCIHCEIWRWPRPSHQRLTVCNSVRAHCCNLLSSFLGRPNASGKEPHLPSGRPESGSERLLPEQDDLQLHEQHARHRLEAASHQAGSL